MKQREGKIFNLKPEMTLPMKLAASFAITYYGLLLIFDIFTLVFRRYYFDSYYFNQGEGSRGFSEYVIQIIQLTLLVLLVFSLIQIFRKKNHGKGIFVGASLLLIIFQLITTGFVPWMKYALEVLLILIIAPVRVKKRTKKDKLSVEDTVEEAQAESTISEASPQPAEQP